MGEAYLRNEHGLAQMNAESTMLHIHQLAAAASSTCGRRWAAAKWWWLGIEGNDSHVASVRSWPVLVSRGAVASVIGAISLLILVLMRKRAEIWAPLFIRRLAAWRSP